MHVVIGLVAMFYDHILTFPAEVSLVWRARPSFGRNGFLLNKYLVLACLVINAHCESPCRTSVGLDNHLLSVDRSMQFRVESMNMLIQTRYVAYELDDQRLKLMPQ